MIEGQSRVTSTEERERAKKALAARPASLHLLEKRVPCPSIQVTTPVFIKAMSGTAIFLGYVQRFT